MATDKNNATIRHLPKVNYVDHVGTVEQDAYENALKDRDTTLEAANLVHEVDREFVAAVTSNAYNKALSTHKDGDPKQVSVAPYGMGTGHTLGVVVEEGLQIVTTFESAANPLLDTVLEKAQEFSDSL